MSAEVVKEYSVAKIVPIIDEILSEGYLSNEVIWDIEVFKRKGASLPFAVASAIVVDAKRLDKIFIVVMNDPAHNEGSPQYTDEYYPVHSKRILWAEGYIRSADFMEDYLDEQARLKRQQLERYEEYFGKPFGTKSEIEDCVANFMVKHFDPIAIGRFHTELAWISKLLMKDPSGFVLMDTLYEEDNNRLLKRAENIEKLHGPSVYGNLLDKVHFGLVRAGYLNYKKYYNYFNE